MADDRHYVMGDYYRICERTGFKVRANRTRQEWTGRIVRTVSWEPRQMQDFVRGVVDDQTVPMPRPRQTDVFIGPLTTTITANAAAGANTLSVSSSVRMQIGDTITLILSNGDSFRTNISNVPTPTSVRFNPVLPYAVARGAPLVDVSAVSPPYIG